MLLIFSNPCLEKFVSSYDFCIPPYIYTYVECFFLAKLMEQLEMARKLQKFEIFISQLEKHQSSSTWEVFNLQQIDISSELWLFIISSMGCLYV